MADNSEKREVSDKKENASVVSEMKPIPGPHEISPLREAAFIFGICLTQMLTQACVAQTIPTVMILAEHFHVEHSPGDQAWFSAAFSLTVGTFILISGRLGDIYGYKTIYIIAYVILTVVALLLGFSAYTTSVVFFTTMRGLQGFAFSLAFPNSAALITHYYPPGVKRIVFMCMFGAVAPTGAILGALFASVLAVKAWWPWAFWILAIVSIATAAIGYFAIPAQIGNHSETIRDFDWLGSITGVSGLILFNFAWNQGPNVGWDTPYVYVLLIVGVLSMVAFLIVEQKVANPLIPPGIVQGANAFVLVCIGAGWSSFGVWLYYSFRMSLLLDEWGPILSSVHAIPCLVAGILAAGTTALLLHKVKVSYIMFGAMLSFFIANVLIGTRPIRQIYWTAKFFSYAIAPFGMDMSFPAATLVLAASLPKRQQGIAASLVATVVNYSISIGLGFAGTVEYYAVAGKEETFDIVELGIRRACYMGMGLAGLGVVSAFSFIIVEHWTHKPDAKSELSSIDV